ncbi:MAG TPA: hypothetical protein DCG75_13290 [Bacteroidales bacterium]|jgi:hypothetical protein|nr:hypothetical protein [Bacteroidales bacterium]
MDENNIYNQLKELLDKAGGKFNILEEQIDVELQLEFFELVNKLLKKKRSSTTINTESIKLFESEISDEEKKRILAELSIKEDVESYRIIEKFISLDNKDLKKWAVLALQHSRISLETYLLDEQQVFISTGLGGSKNKLRYFIAGKLKTGERFTDTQKKVIKTEFEIIFKSFDSKIENFTFTDEYFTILCLIPIEISIGEVLKNSIDESNQFGNFLYSDYLVTNVRILKMDEIIGYFKKKGI